MSFRALLVILLIANLTVAFTWPWEVQQKAKDQPSPTEEEETPPQAPTGAPTQANAQTAPKPFQPPSLPPVVKPPATVKVVKPPVPVLPPPVAPVKPAIPTPVAIADVQKQIDEIIQINRKLQRQQMDQIADVRRIMDQVNVHQKILNDIKSKAETKPKITAANTEELLEQEKIRLILSETNRNREQIKKIEEKYIQDLKKSAPSPEQSQDEPEEAEAEEAE